MNKKLLIIGISGGTCGGKTTLANELNKLLPNSQVISQNNYFLDESDERHSWIPELNHANYEILSSLDMNKMYVDIQNCVKNYNLIEDLNTYEEKANSSSLNNNIDNNNLYSLIKNLEIEIIIVEGFLIFHSKFLLPLFDLMYYFTLTREECYRRRNQLTYEAPDCPGYFEKCAWPEYLKQYEEVKNLGANIKYFDGSTKNYLEEVCGDIANILKNP